MSKPSGLYGLIQFSAYPERFEFVNIGVLLVEPSERFLGVKFADSFNRLDKVFGRQSRSFIEAIKKGLPNRLAIELGPEWDINRLRMFARSRANSIRISRLLPIAIENPENDLDELFKLLVTDDIGARRSTKINIELREKFERAGIANFITKPQPIALPQGVTIDAPYSYRNGTYNLIEAVRLRGPAPDALAQASKRAMEGKWLRDYSISGANPTRLVVVAEVSELEPAFVNAIGEMMRDHHVRLYDLEDLEPLVEEIKRTGAAIGSPSRFL